MSEEQATQNQDLRPLAGLDIDHIKVKPGNQLWKKAIENRKFLGPVPSPEALAQIVSDYFEWLEDNPINEAKLVTYEGVSNLEDIPKMRAPTLYGLCAFIGIHRDTWGSWRRGDDRTELRQVVEWAEQVMAEWKFTGAAAGVLNPVIITRDLGLADKQEVTSPDGSMTPVVQYQLPSNGRD